MLMPGLYNAAEAARATLVAEARCREELRAGATIGARPRA